MWSPRNFVKAFDMWVLSVLQEENKLWLKTKLCSRNSQHNTERLVQVQEVRPELGCLVEAPLCGFPWHSRAFCGSLEASLIASCLNLVLELTTHKYLYKYSMFIYNTLVEPFRAFLLLKFLIEGVCCHTVKVRKILWAIKVETFQALWVLHDKSEAAFFPCFEDNLLPLRNGFWYYLLLGTWVRGFLSLVSKKQTFMELCTDKQKDKLGMICSGKNPNVLICVYVILVSLLEPSLPSLDLMIMLSTVSIFILKALHKHELTWQLSLKLCFRWHLLRCESCWLCLHCL